MSGFMPLVEGFLAFAMTMLALTTGVSALVGIWHRFRRQRARGLREMVRALYLREVFAKLDRSERRSYPADVGDRNKGPYYWERAHQAQFIAQLTLTPQVDVVQDIEVAHLRRASADQAEAKAGVPEARAKSGGGVFLGKRYTSSKWMSRIESAEGLESDLTRAPASWWGELPGWLQHPKRSARRWRTLRITLDSLSDEAFRERFVTSDVGKQLCAKKFGRTPSNQDELDAVVEALSEEQGKAWSAEVDKVQAQFKAIGAAASERFARESRTLSVFVGLSLAFVLNIDTFDLLNTYLQDPALRAAAIQSAERYRSGTAEFAAAEESVVAGLRAQIGTAAEGMRSGIVEVLQANGISNSAAAGIVDEVFARFPPPLGTAEPDAQGNEEAGSERGIRERVVEALVAMSIEQSVIDEVDRRLQEIAASIDELQALLQRVNQVADEIEQAEREAIGVVQALDAAFPIGRERFPFCGSGNQAGAESPVQPRPALQVEQGSESPGRRRPEPVVDRRCIGYDTDRDPSWWLWFSGRDSVWWQWFLGTALTGAMLGLGTPFWVQVVNGATAARGQLRGRTDSAETDTK